MNKNISLFIKTLKPNDLSGKTRNPYSIWIHGRTIFCITQYYKAISQFFDHDLLMTQCESVVFLALGTHLMPKEGGGGLTYRNNIFFAEIYNANKLKRKKQRKKIKIVIFLKFLFKRNWRNGREERKVVTVFAEVKKWLGKLFMLNTMWLHSSMLEMYNKFNWITS